MATFGSNKHTLTYTLTPADASANGLGAKSYTDSGTTDVSAVLYSEFTITKATADTTVSLGNVSGAKHLLVMASEAVDAAYLSTIVGDVEIAVGQDCFGAMNLSAEATALHIDCTGSAANVNVVVLLISEA